MTPISPDAYYNPPEPSGPECPECGGSNVSVDSYCGVVTFQCQEPDCGHSWDVAEEPDRDDYEERDR